MAKQILKTAREHLVPLNMNGLQGRMLRFDNPKRKREILLLYGHHASLERMSGFAELLHEYGTVTIPDLPGFGGMEPFFDIGEKPTLDNFADYLASFIKLRYKQRRFTLVAMSFSFIVVTRMLQKYPEIAKKVDLLVSIVGFAHKDDFAFKRRNYWILRLGAVLLSYRLPAFLFRYLVLQAPIIRLSYFVGEKFAIQNKMRDTDAAERAKRINFEVVLWQCNEVRTYGRTSVAMFTLKPLPIRVDLPVHHVAVENDRYFDNGRVEEHMRWIFKNFTLHKTIMPDHVPSIVATAAEAAPFLPASLRRILRKRP